MTRTVLMDWLVATVIYASATALLPHAAAENRPNMVVILADDLGYGDVGCYGAQDLRTPHVDALVSAGMRFDSFYANCPVCSPTRASLLSGRYPELVGVPGVIRTHETDSWGYLDPHAVLLPRVLQDVGYTTALVGKWHLGLQSPNLPNERGFDLFHGFLGDMMDDYFTHRRHNNNYMYRNRTAVDPEGHATELFTKWAIEFIRHQADLESPFFLYLAFNAPHTPIQPPEAWLRRVLDRTPGISEKRAKLVALIEHMDDGVGRVVSALRDSKQIDRTLFVFTSDNGGQLNVGADNGPLRDGKQSMYEGGLRVPFCAVWPGKIEPGSRGQGVWLTMDLYPTLCEAAGASISHRIEGVSFLPTLVGASRDPIERDVFFHRREGGLRYQGLTIQAMRRGQWKLLANSPFQPWELYDLVADPQEAHNLAKERPRLFRELSAALREQIQRGGAVPWQPPARRDTGFP